MIVNKKEKEEVVYDNQGSCFNVEVGGILRRWFATRRKKSELENEPMPLFLWKLYI